MYKHHIYWILASIMVSTSALGELIVNPTDPTSSDVVTIDYSSWLPCPAYVVTNTFHTIDENNIFLGIQSYFQGLGCADVLVPYAHTFTIGPIPAGVYQVQSSLELLVGTEATYRLESTMFEVVPEPSTGILTMVGSLGLLLYARSRRREKQLRRPRFPTASPPPEEW